MTYEIIDSNGDQRTVSDVQIVAPNGTLRDADRKDIVNPDGDLETVWPPDNGVDESEYLNLASEVPTQAWDLWESKPSFHNNPDYNLVDASSYDGRNDDLSQLIETASANDELVDLGSGTYEMTSTVGAGLGDTIGGIVGDSDNPARIYYTGTHLDRLFYFSGIDEFVMEGVTFDISEEVEAGVNSDVTVLECSGIRDNGWFEDVRLEGARHRNQDIDGDGEYETVGGLYTFLPQAASTGEVFCHRCEFPDGGTDMSEEIGTDSDHAIGPNTDYGAHGYHVFKDCYCARFYGNGFYAHIDDEYATGPVILWNCTAENNGKGNMRVSTNQKIIGGSVTIDSAHPGLGDHPSGTPLVVGEGSNIEVIGLEITVEFVDPDPNDPEATNWGAEAIQIRRGAEDLRLDRVVLNVVSGPSRPVRASVAGSAENPLNVELDDIYWYDDGDNNRTLHISSPEQFDNPSVNVTIMDPSTCRIAKPGATDDEIIIGTEGTLDVAGTTYSNETVSISELNLGDPLGDDGELPNFYFEYEDPPE